MARAPGTFAAALALAAALGCQRPAEKPLVVGSLRLPATALLLLADHSGCLAGGNGPRIVLRRYATGREAIAALRAGEVEVATAFQSPVVRSALEEPDLRILTTLHTATRNTYLVARADHGIAGTADLRGKRVGAPAGTNAEFFVRTLLTFEGIDPGEVNVVDVASDRAAAALAAGELDAVALWSPLVDEAAAAVPPEHRVEIFSDVYLEASMLVTLQRIREARPAALQKLVRCVAGAQDTIDAAGDGGRQIAGRLFPEIVPARLASQWDAIAPHVGLQNVLLSTLSQEAGWLGANDPGDVHGRRFVVLFAPEFLEAAAPETVTVSLER